MVGGQHHDPAVLPPGKTRYPMYMRVGGTRSRSGQVRKTSSQRDSICRPSSPLASRYTDCAIPTPVSVKQNHMLYTIITQLISSFPAYDWPMAFTPSWKTMQWNPSWATLIQSLFSYSTSVRSILTNIIPSIPMFSRLPLFFPVSTNTFPRYSRRASNYGSSLG